LSECVEFYPGAFDPANPRKGGSFELIQEKKWDNTPEDELRHDVTDELAAYKLAQLPFPASSASFTKTTGPRRMLSRKNGSRPLARRQETLRTWSSSRRHSTE
jgi:2-oxoglutarate ferredoxin oxidoreductase subunit beta